MNRSSRASSAAVGSAGGGVGPPVGPVGAHRGARPLEGAVDGRHGHVELRGRLGGREVEHVAQDEHRPLTGRQQLDRRQVGELDGLATDGERIGLRLARRDLVEEVVGERLEPRHLAQRAQGPRLRAPVGAADRVEADVRRDAVEPRAERGRAVERVSAAPRAQERLLHGVLGVLEGAEHAIRVHTQLGPIGFGPSRECRVGQGHQPARLPEMS